MATVRQIWDALRTSIKTITDPLSPPVTVFIDTPPTDVLQNLARGGSSIISIFDCRASSNKTRWIGNTTIQDIVQPTAVKSVIGTANIQPSGSTTITLSRTPNLNDAVSCVLSLQLVSRQTVAITIADDTLQSLTDRFVQQINHDLAGWVTATNVGPIITLTNVSGRSLALQSYTGNNALRQDEVARVMRAIQISVYCQTEELREQVGNPVMSLIGRWQKTYGLKMPDSTIVRILYNSDEPGDYTHNADIYCWDFIVDVEHGITAEDVLYSVLAPVPQFSLGL